MICSRVREVHHVSRDCRIRSARRTIRALTISTGKDRSTAEHFGQDTSHRPYIDCLGILLESGKKRNIDQLQSVISMSGRARGRSDSVSRSYVNMISGARYHLVATYSVMKPVSPPFGCAVCVDLANPKSHTLRSQLALSSKFDGFRSRWMTSAEWRALSARRVW